MSESIFFYQYNSPENYRISVEKNIVGCLNSGNKLPQKFRRLKTGDIIIIRNSAKKELSFFGYGEVIGEVYNQYEDKTIFPNWVWEDEKSQKKIIYPYRVAVNFAPSFVLQNIKLLEWKDFLNLGWKTKRDVLFDQVRLSAFFSGNQVSVGDRFSTKDFTKLKELLGFAYTNQTQIHAHDIGEIVEPKRAEVKIMRIIRDTKLSSEVKIKNVYKCQICGNSIPLHNGNFYAEAHHIKPLGKPHNGPDTLDNIICVCPNHHAMLDYGIIELGHNIQLNRENISTDYIEYHNNYIFKNSK